MGRIDMDELEENDALERIAEAQERQAEAMELAAGMMMLQYHYNEETVDFSSEALKEEALHFARGGEF